MMHLLSGTVHSNINYNRLVAIGNMARQKIEK